MMNNQVLNNKVNQDVVKIKEDLGTLVEDSAVRLNAFEGDVSQAVGKAKGDVTTWVESSVTHLGEGIEKVTSDAKETVVVAAAAVKKDVGHGLSQYNAKAQEVANKVPGGFAEKAVSYPWVAMSIALIVGFLLRGLMSPARKTII